MITLNAWLSKATPEQRKALAKAAKISVQGLAHIAHGHRRGSAKTAIDIWLASKGKITLRSVCPALRKLEPLLKTRR